MHTGWRKRRALLVAAALMAHLATGGAIGQVQGGKPPARLALVIGNSDYTLAPALRSCTASANLTAARLRAAGFEVAEHLDASNGGTGAALTDLAQAIATHPGAAAIVYVCGYGLNFRDRDFMLPVSAMLTRPSDVLTEGVVARAFGMAAASPDTGGALVLLDLFALPDSHAPAPAGTAAQESANGSVATAVVLEPPGPVAATPAATALAKLLGESEVKLPGVIEELQELMPRGGPSLVGKREATADLLLVGQPPTPEPSQAPAQSALKTAPALPGAPAPGAGASALRQPAAATPAQPGPPTAPEPNAGASAAQAPLASPSAGASQAAPGPTAAASRPPLPDEAKMTYADRRDVQIALARLGYYDGRIDGVIGPDTRAAIRRWQHEIGAEMDGALSGAQATRLVQQP